MPGSRFFIKAILFGVLLIMSSAMNAQEPGKKNAWPDHLKLQHAGGIGYFSIGAGYLLGNGNLEADLMYGFVPESIGGLDIHSLSSRISWLPIKSIGSSLRLEPLATGVIVNYTFGKQYFGFTPENYPFAYYNYPTSLHAAFFPGQMKVHGFHHPLPDLLYSVEKFLSILCPASYKHGSNQCSRCRTPGQPESTSRGNYFLWTAGRDQSTPVRGLPGF